MSFLGPNNHVSLLFNVFIHPWTACLVSMCVWVCADVVVVVVGQPLRWAAGQCWGSSWAGICIYTQADTGDMYL